LAVLLLIGYLKLRGIKMKLFGQTPKEFFAKKVNLISLAAMVTAIVAYKTGAIDAVAFTNSMFAAAMAIAFRDTAAKIEKKGG